MLARMASDDAADLLLEIKQERRRPVLDLLPLAWVRTDELQLLVPLAQDWDVRRLARELGLGVVIAARPGLGTINHTLLTLEAARMAALDVRAVVLTPWPADPGPIERSNATTIERLGGVAVATLPALAEISAATLAAAGAALPYESWLV